MNPYLDWTITVLGYICWPIYVLLYYLAVAVLGILKLLYIPVASILQPVVYLTQFLLACVLFPFKLLAKLEPLYNYLGVAVLVGVLGGLAVAYTCIALYGLLGLDAASSSEPYVPRTAKQYREEKAKLKPRVDQPLLSPHKFHATDSVGQVTGKSKNRSLLAQTIMEEVDSASDY